VSAGARRPGIRARTCEDTSVFSPLRKLPSRRPTRRTPRLEWLEDRCTPAPITTASVNLSAAEQFMLEMINRARGNPPAEAARLGIGLNDGLPAGTISGAPVQPLAPNPMLQTVAEQHSFDMIVNNYFSHTSPTAGDLTTRIAAAGYSANQYGENIASGPLLNNSLGDTAGSLENSLFNSPGHRQNLLDGGYNEVGVGIDSGLGPLGGTQVDATQDFGGRSQVVYLTGVAYTDTDHNNFYSPGEGIAGTAVTATNLDAGQAYATTTADGGGYEIALPAGRYRVSILGVSGTVTIGSANGKVDYQSGTLTAVDPGSIGAPPPTPAAPPAKAAPGTFPAAQAGVFRDGTWILDTTHTQAYNAADAVYSFGMPGDVPVVGDWTGDGHDKIGVFRANADGSGEFILDTNGDGVIDAGDTVFTFGLAGDRVVVGDWNGDGKSKVGVFRANADGVGVFSLDTNGDHQFDAGDDVFTFGLATDQIVIGDWNGDGKSKVGVFRANADGVGVFSLDTNGDRQFDANSSVFTFGLAGDKIVIGDWNGDGRAKVGVVRSAGAQAIWALDLNGNLQFDASDPVFYFGLATDKPVVGRW
jgi:hypothetical protein